MHPKFNIYLSRLCILSLLIVCTVHQLYGTHNRAGEIVYEQIGPLTIQATIKTYTKASSTAADRDSLELFWGDGSSTVLSRSNGNGTGETIAGTDVKLNCYVGQHTYASRATYTLSFSDPNRVTGILNVNYPNSVDIPFYLETTFTLLNTQFQGLNNSVILLEAPLDYACMDKTFIHNPNAFDIDGDSIGYELVIPLMEEDTDVPNYAYPNEIIEGIDNQIFLDPLTGNFEWNTPKAIGEYNIAIKISEYRNGQLISSTTRDMQIFVDNCDDNPPTVESTKEICVEAGELVDIPINIGDIDPNDQVKISATGGPFFIDPPNAELNGPEDFVIPPYTANLTWQTVCDHAREQHYQVVISAEDLVGLVNVHTIGIKVLAPAPESLEVEHSNDQNTLSWDYPYACNHEFSDNFLGFAIWRKIGSNPFELQECEVGLENKGYERIDFLVDTVINESYQYNDKNIDDNIVYCYRVTAVFARLNTNQNPVNSVESKPSNEVCILANRAIPYITKNDVAHTDQVNGRIDIEWLIPDAIAYDTTQNSGPYRLEVFQGSPMSTVPLFEVEYAHFADIPVLDSMTIDAINTLEVQYAYHVNLVNSANFKSSSDEATSIFLSTKATDREVELTWQVNVPWENTSYQIYRSESGSSFELIDETKLSKYRDINLSNGTEYCYLIKSIGTFSIEPFPEPIINHSQESCITPIDNLAPCSPIIQAIGICAQIEEGESIDEIFNEVSWNFDATECSEFDDIEYFQIYYGITPNAEFELLDNVDHLSQMYTDSRRELIGGCYYILAIDRVGNVSLPSDTLCLSKCSIFELPNTFTPNDDGSNDFFIPRKNYYVDVVDFRVFNKWGNLVYETSDPALNWDGKNQNNQNVDDGTYYYTCEIFQTNDLGVNEFVEVLSGYIEVLR